MEHKYAGQHLAKMRRNKEAWGVMGKLVHGLFHHEPLGLRRPITWSAPAGFGPETARYHAARGNASGNTSTDPKDGKRVCQIATIFNDPTVDRGGK
jgi:hypothetical protein